METEPKKHQRFTKRREREKKPNANGSADEVDELPSRSDKRCKPRRKKNNANIFEEDIIDGFAIVSFKSFEDLENAVKNSMNLKAGSEKKEKKSNNNREKQKHCIKKKDKNKSQNRVNSPPPSPQHKPNLDDNLDCSPCSDKTEVLDLHFNGTEDQPNSVSQDQLSDASSHSSSGRGYLCDSESGDDRASDASSDIFTAVNRSRECHIPNTASCNSPCPPIAVTTTTTLKNSLPPPTVPASSVITTTATTTTSALAVAAATNSITSTTTSCSSASKTPITTPSVIFNGPKVNQAPPVKHPPPHNLSPVPSLPASRPSSVSSAHRDHIHKSSSPLQRNAKREEFRDKDTPLPSNLSFNKPWASANSSSSHHLYSPQISPTAGLPSSFHSTPNHTPTFPQHTPLLPHPPSAHTPGHPAHSMFAPPLPPGPAAGSLSSGSLGGAASHSPGDSMSYANQELLRDELNRRFLATQDRPSPAVGGSPYMRTDIHQHQHQHMHQHQHTHQHMYPIPFSASLAPPPAPLLYEKVPKLTDSPFYRQGIPGLPAYPGGISPIMPPTGGPLNSGIPGAFQPKRISSSVHPAQMRLASLRDLDKAAPNPVGSLPPQKKSGKWCAVHVRIAWEIYQHQQKQAEVQKGSDGNPKSLEPIRPPSHLHPLNSSLHKPPELNSASSLLASASHNRNLLDNQAQSFLNSNHLNVAPFPRPSPYSIGAGLGSFGGLGKGNGPFSGPRELPAVPGITPPHEWNRLHRTPPSFPTPTSWPKPLEDREKEREREFEREREKEREIEKEREKDKEKERESLFALDRRRDEDRERERRNSERERLGLTPHGVIDRSRERERLFGHTDNRPSRSRSRSRSPLQNGRVGSAKSNSSYERDIDNKSNILKIKEERREEDSLHSTERENKIRNDYLFAGPMPNPAASQLNMFERARQLGQPPFFMDRVPPHPALWSHYEKSAIDFNHHRLQLAQEMDRERERMMSRLQHPATSLQALEQQERLRKEEVILQQEERFRREYLERLPMYERERLAAYHEQSRLSGFRAGDLAAAHHFTRTISPMLNHTGPKGGSPACAPPPLIPSSSATSRSHSNSPAVGKPKIGIHGSGMVDPLADKRDAYSNSTDPESHSR